MRVVTTLGMFVVVLGLVGCGETVSTQNNNTNRKLSLTGPGNTTIEQGESETIKISIDRDNFNDPVTVDFENVPAGVKIVESDRTIPAGKESMNFTMQVARDAQPVKDHPVRVKASGGGLKTEPAQFMLEIEKKD